MARLSMSELTTYRWSFQDDVRHCRAAGFDGLGVWRDKLSDCGDECGSELLDLAGLHVSSLSWAGGFTGSDGRSHKDAVSDALAAVRLAGRLRTGCLIVHSGARGGHTHRHVRRMFCQALERILFLAEQLDVTIALEPLHPGCSADWTFLNGLDGCLDLLHDIGSPNLKLVLDTYHLAHDESALCRLDEVARRTALVQLGDAREIPRDEPNRCRLGDGVLPLNRFVGTLLSCGYDGFFEVELSGEDVEAEDYHDLLAHSRQAFEDLVGAAQAY
jgi:sugar phosphate isomerase/epimerase